MYIMLHSKVETDFTVQSKAASSNDAGYDKNLKILILKSSQPMTTCVFYGKLMPRVFIAFIVEN